MSPSDKRIILIDDDSTREVLARRLRAQGYLVDEAADAASGAHMALCSPPAAVVADLWMPTISGVQLCRLLRSEAATADVPVILRGPSNEPRDRFWSERAGATAYVVKGRMGELVRALAAAVSGQRSDDGFFMQLTGDIDVRDRIARSLDTALFESVIASEVRALGTCGSFERLFDLFVQFLSQVTRYRWVAIAMDAPKRFAIHRHPTDELAEAQALAMLRADATGPIERVLDEDAENGSESHSATVCAVPIVCQVTFANMPFARLALSPSSTTTNQQDGPLLSLVAGELGGPLRMAMLVEESQRLASTDTLTGLMNRRAYAASMQIELSRSMRHNYPLSLILLDIDHFKVINDKRGHLAGDCVLAAMGALLKEETRIADLAARWGGEEFVITFTSTPLDGGVTAAERIRKKIEQMQVRDSSGDLIQVTASIGIAQLKNGEPLDSLVDRADRAMYASKTSGRNRVSVCAQDASEVEALKGVA